MICFFKSWNQLLFPVLALSMLLTTKSSAQVFELDMTSVPENVLPIFKEIEDDLNSRVQNYSNELPLALLYQLDKVRIVVNVVPAPEGILGFAGPTAIVTHQAGDLFRTHRRAVVVAGQVTINSNEIPFMLADNILGDTFAHEILHAFGFGSLWEENDLVGPVGGVGTTQYIGGRYAIEQYREEANLPFAVFVPLEQGGGGGTALSHWADQPPFFNQTFTPAFTKELMTGFACDIHPVTGAIVCPPTFLSMTTEGAMADLGFAMFKLNPNSSPPPTGQAGNNWPKIIGSGVDPFAGPIALGGDNNLGFKLVNIQRVYKKHKKVTAEVNSENPTPIHRDDPFRLRNHGWSK